MSKMRGSKPSAEARSARVTTQSKPSGLLSYATRGQLTLRPQAMGGKPSLSKTVGHYPGGNTGRDSKQMPASVEILKKMRDSYGSKKDNSSDSPDERVFELSDEESQGLKEGQEVSAQITGTFKDGCIYAADVKLAPSVGADAMPMQQAPPAPMMVRNNIQQVPG